MPPEGMACWLVMRRAWTDRLGATAWLARWHTATGWGDGVDEARVAYWLPVILPPGPVTVGIEGENDWL